VPLPGLLPARLRPSARVVDGLLVAAALALAVIGATAPPDDPSLGRGLARFGLAALAAVALWWRRRYPLAVLAVTCAASFAVVAIGALNVTAVAVAVALYAYASRTDRSSGLLAGVGAIAATVAARMITGAVLPDSTLTTLVLLAAACAAGLYAGTRHAYVARLTDRADRAEQEREQFALQAASDERARIARELHDVIAHHVSLMVVQAGALSRRDDAHDPSAPSLDSIAETGREALAELRRLLGILRPDATAADLAPQPGLHDVTALADQMRASGLDVTVAIEGRARTLPSGVDLAAYRIVQESLTNVVKHAGVTTAEVRIRYDDDGVALAILDDGVGGRAAADPRGHGLVGMRERVALYRGTLSLGPREHGGFAVEARLPSEAAGS
jgi:signal transduction histidine kinase